MSNTLPIAIDTPIPHEECNFVVLDIPSEIQNLFCMDIIVETNHQLIEYSIGHALSITYEGIFKYIGGKDKITRCQIKPEGWRGNISGRYEYVRCITYAQFIELWDKALHANCMKKKPILAEFMATKVLPLFTKALTTPKMEVATVATPEVQTMTSLEIAELTGKVHKNVMRDIEKLINELGDELKIEPISYIDKMNRKQKIYKLDRESTLLLTSGYSAQLRLKIIRRLDELETGKVTPPQAQPTTPVVPQNLPDALRLAATLAEEKEALAHERDEAVRTKAMIGSKREAAAMSKAGNLAKKVKQLELMISDATKSPTYDYATVLAIQSRYKQTKVSGLKLTYYCRRMGLEMRDIPDPKYGYVHSYPAEAWRGVYGIDINNVLKRVA